MPDESVIFGDEDVGVTVPVQVHELQIRIARAAVETRGKGA